MATWYYIHNSNKNITSTDPSLSTSTFSFNVEIGGVDCGKCTKQYKSTATSISAFRNINQRLVFGNKKFNNVSVWCHVRSNSPYGTIKTWVDVTEQFTIKTYSSSGIIDLQATNDFVYSSSYVYLYVAIDEEFSTTYTITNNNTNCVCNSVIKSEYEKNENITLEFTANEGYAFKDNSISLTAGALDNASATYSDDRKTVIVTGVIIGNLTINITAYEVHTVSITGTLKNCTCNYSDGEFLDINKDIIINANEGYTFKNVYTYRKGVQTFEFNNYETYLKIKLSEYDLKYDFYLDDDYIATKEIEQLGSFANLYKTNQTELTELSKVRFYEELGQITDYGQFITSLYVLPFNIPSDILGDKSTILLGNFDSGVESTLLATYSFDIDAGEIEVPLKYNNIYDFMNTECILHLPFLNNVYLNTEYVIGQKLTITFTIELYSGTLTANIKSSFNDEIVASVQGLVGMSIPFIQKSNNVINSVSNVYKNKIDRCFIEVNRNIPYTKNNNIFGGDVVEYGRIGDYTGYIECDKIVLETNATNQEQEEIKNLLRNGVFL